MEISVAVKETLTALRDAFPDERACEAFLFAKRWPDGFVCQECGGRDYTRLSSRAFTYQCSRCRRQTSITAGTVMDRSKLPLTAWLWAAGLFTSHPGSVSVHLFEVVFGISRPSARLMLRKFEQLLIAFSDRPLEGLVGIDHAELQLRAADGSVDESLAGRVKIIVALEASSGRIRAAHLPDDAPAFIESFVRSNVKRGELLRTKKHSAYLELVDYRHDPSRIGDLLFRTERVFNLARKFLRTHYGQSRDEVESALDEFVADWNWNPRRRRPSFDTLIGLALEQKPTSHWDILGRDNPRKGNPTIRRKPRRRKTAAGMREDGSGAVVSSSPILRPGR
jgi:hypothetical protein